MDKGGCQLPNKETHKISLKCRELLRFIPEDYICLDEWFKRELPCCVCMNEPLTWPLAASVRAEAGTTPGAGGEGAADWLPAHRAPSSCGLLGERLGDGELLVSVTGPRRAASRGCPMEVERRKNLSVLNLVEFSGNFQSLSGGELKAHAAASARALSLKPLRVRAQLWPIYFKFVTQKTNEFSLYIFVTVI